ncbi:DUF4913 domain-containing protein [Nocardia sp. alder85J]|uniref:DUF4913 domain-containing protein n=1 Tax=Nocardia sp. alder85J TaxID=2862949 RepID=UPI001CD4E942|nr:DUF4913 domain-containing protein [Nocardia sp. alder85J]MCX4098420.1 DUF4913 domain-containing protein [Nocardia sp. alder85J]
MSAPDEPPPPEFEVFHDWVQEWLTQVVSRRLLTGNREGTYTWCAQWWRHTEVCFRLAAMHQGWEEARVKGGSAMSSWCVYHLDPQLRVLLDAANGPLWRCIPDHHVSEQTLPTEPVPAGWFDIHDDSPDPALEPTTWPLTDSEE